MKKNIFKSLSLAGVALFGIAATGCSDDYMEDLNTDPSKAATIDPNAQLTTAQLQTYGDLGQVEIYRNYHYAFTQQLMGCWNTTNYGGHHTIDNNEMCRTWTSFYPNAVKNLVDGIYRSANDDAKRNVNAALRIYRVYVMSLITDIYGDCPYTEAGLGYLEEKFNPRYDTQEEIYYDFFTELKGAAEQLDPSADRITGDVIFSGDIAKWKKFANSLRLRYAMRISGVNPSKARNEFEDALNATGGVMASADDDALIHYMDVAFSFGQESYSDYRGNALSQLWFGNDPANNPSYICSTFFNYLKDTSDPRCYQICRFYYDGLMSATKPDGRVDLTEEIIAKGVKMEPCDPGTYSWDNWPTGYASEILAEMAINNPSIDPNVAREVRPKLASNFLKGDCPGVVMTYAEVNFLLAEAALNNWAVGGNAEMYYKAGVRAAMDFLHDNYGTEQVSDADFASYMSANQMGYTVEQRRMAVNTQAWLHHFTNPNECWANVRRSGFPRLKSPEAYGQGAFLTGGVEIPVRLCYPVLESSYNKQGYDEALDRMGGSNSWNIPLWWDVN